MALYLAAVIQVTGEGLPATSARYLFDTFLGAAAQVVATMLLIMMFRLRNFAVGTMLTKVDIVITAVLGWALFSERLTWAGAGALVIVLLGVLLISAGRSGVAALLGGTARPMALLADRATAVALGCAVCFSLSYLFLREATIELGQGSPAWRGAWTVVIATAMQTLFVGVWLWAQEPQAFRAFWPNRTSILFIGTTSALGSIGWFTAFALQNASYVRAVGQIEVVFTLLLSWWWFRERITSVELAGMAATLIGIVAFRLGT
jgi:drug/metabolite transporter (DMT)-like permease